MYHKKTHFHFIGIGGIGMSGIAKILKKKGYEISGCDLDLSQQSIAELESIECAIYEGNNTLSCKDPSIDTLIYSSAIKNNDPEIIAAQERGIPTIARAHMLAELMRTKYSIAISGSHGKTTTTSMTSHILIETKKDPTVIVGGHIKNISSNARMGHGEFLVAEADESDKTLTRYHPTIAVVTNIDLEHLDVYKDIEDIKNTFYTFLTNVPFYGKAILCADDLHSREIMPRLAHIKLLKYSIELDAEYKAEEIDLFPTYSRYLLKVKNEKTCIPVIVPMPGRHNILNSLAAIAATHELGLDLASIVEALSSFKGVERRFSFCGTYKGAELFDDYGHHPTEINHALTVARNRAKKRVIVVFQPHRYSRTQKLWKEFISTFQRCNIDHLIITDIYPASETPIPEITGKNLAEALSHTTKKFQVEYAPMTENFVEIHARIDEAIQKEDLVLFLGAGKTNKIAEKLAR